MHAFPFHLVLCAIAADVPVRVTVNVTKMTDLVVVLALLHYVVAFAPTVTSLIILVPDDIFVVPPLVKVL